MKIKILNIHEAYELYVLLKPVFPKMKPDEELMDFFHALVKSISEANPDILREMISLFSEEKEVKINWRNHIEVLSILIMAFTKNEVVGMVDFFDRIIDG